MIQLDDPGPQLSEFLIQFGLLFLKLLLCRLPLGGLPAVLQLDLPHRQPLLLQLPVDLADLVDLQPSPLAPTRPDFRMVPLELLPDLCRFRSRRLLVDLQRLGDPVEAAPGHPFKHQRPIRLLLGRHLELADPREVLVGQFIIPRPQQPALHRHGHLVGHQRQGMVGPHAVGQLGVALQLGGHGVQVRLGQPSVFLPAAIGPQPVQRLAGRILCDGLPQLVAQLLVPPRRRRAQRRVQLRQEPGPLAAGRVAHQRHHFHGPPRGLAGRLGQIRQTPAEVVGRNPARHGRAKPLVQELPRRLLRCRRQAGQAAISQLKRILAAHLAHLPAVIRGPDLDHRQRPERAESLIQDQQQQAGNHQHAGQQSAAGQPDQRFAKGQHRIPATPLAFLSLGHSGGTAADGSVAAAGASWTMVIVETPSCETANAPVPRPC